MKKVLTLIIFITILSSCKDDKNTEKTSIDTTEAIKYDNIFRVSFNLIIKKDDNLHVYYTEDGTLNFNEQKTVWLPIKGSENPQNVTFSLPENVIPTHLRVDFGYGKNVEQSDVDLKTFSIKYYDKKIEAKGIDILKYFYPFEAKTSILPGTSILRRFKKDQETGPILYPHILLSQKIKEITKG